MFIILLNLAKLLYTAYVDHLGLMPACALEWHRWTLLFSLSIRRQRMGILWISCQRHSLQIMSFQLLRSEEHTSELQSRFELVCRLLLEKKNKHYEHIKI